MEGAAMIDFPITDLLDDDECLAWLERHLHPQGLVCPTCGSSGRRGFAGERRATLRLAKKLEA
jgi:hypothetical protein